MTTHITQPQAAEPSTPMERVLYEIKKVVVGQDALLERVLVALLARGHILLEGVPGLAKTLTIRTAAEVISGDFKRIQFTPDLVPADLVGTRIYNQRTGDFSTQFGPVFTNLLLADEINRAPAKVQSALLEVMQERQVTIGRESYRVPNPFLVLATQNPIETEGTYQLPEAQVDRFLLKVLVGYPSEREEVVIVQRMTGALQPPRPIISADGLLDLQRQADAVSVAQPLMEYVVRLVSATRRPGEAGVPEVERFLTVGASPRASINLVLAARALALLRGRDQVQASDIRELTPDVLRHRLVLSYEALSDGVSADAIVGRLLERVPGPGLAPAAPASAHDHTPGLRYEQQSA
jgi:MoxR-like ATPase